MGLTGHLPRCDPSFQLEVRGTVSTCHCCRRCRGDSLPGWSGPPLPLQPRPRPPAGFLRSACPCPCPAQSCGSHAYAPGSPKAPFPPATQTAYNPRLYGTPTYPPAHDSETSSMKLFLLSLAPRSCVPPACQPYSQGTAPRTFHNHWESSSHGPFHFPPESDIAARGQCPGRDPGTPTASLPSPQEPTDTASQRPTPPSA